MNEKNFRDKIPGYSVKLLFCFFLCTSGMLHINERLKKQSLTERRKPSCHAPNEKFGF